MLRRAQSFWILACLTALAVCFVPSVLRGQATTSVRGTVTDPSAAAIPNATVRLVSGETGIERTTNSGLEGDYVFSQVLPGTYRLIVEAPGFRKLERENVQLLVNSPATINVELEVGRATEIISVSAEAPVLNTTDASLGIAFNENQIKQLPFESRNVVDLLSLQPGVAYTGNRPDIDRNTDTRSGAVNGARSDQSNVTLDGVDVNDQGNGYAFTSVLPVTLDSVQEFRVTTSNYNADQGRSSGAQVALVTKGGTNSFHGSAYEYHRNTATSANDYFIKLAQLGSGEKNQAPKLLRNVFGGALGGPIKHDRAFFFLNYEGQRDRQEDSVVRVVPTVSLRQGLVRYPISPDEGGGVQTLTPDDLRAMDPLGLGPNPVVLDFLQSYPMPNDSSVGDGLNFSGYRFPGPVQRRFDRYIARFDLKLTSGGNQSLFWRGNMLNADDRGVPYLPGQSSLRSNPDYSKGFVVGHTAILRPTLVNNFRWGLTRQSHAVLGNSDQPWIIFRGLNEAPYNNFAYGRGFTLPVHNFVDDMSWVKGKHSFSFGANVRFIRNPRFSLLNSFPDGVANASWLKPAGLANTQSPLDPAVNGYPTVDGDFNNSYDFPTMALLGIVSEVDAVYNYDKEGNALALGAPLQRRFGADEYEIYAQDAWRIKPNLTLTLGLRYGLFSPPWETNGLQVAPSVSLGQWFEQRGINMKKGIASNQDPLISFDLAGPANGKTGFYGWDKKNFSPRVAIAYSPRPSSGFLKWLTGEADRTSIRAGFGIVYDRIGSGLLNSFDQSGSFGLSTNLTNPANVQTVSSAPRVTGLNEVPASITVPAPAGGFPQTYPSTLDTGGFAITWGLDDTIKTPYSYMLDFSIARELPGNFSVEAAYVGRMAHRLLVQEDLAMPLNLVDKTSGIDYFTAASRLSQLGDAGYQTPDVTDSLVGPTAVYWANLFGPGPYPLADESLTSSAAQAAYDLFADPINGFLHNETTGLAYLDLGGYPATPVGGLYSFYNAQFSSLYAWRSIGNSNYHAMQLTVRRRMAQGVGFDFNYTLSKSIDLSSDAERIVPWGGLGGQIINSWDHKQLRSVSDFDTTHQLNSNWVVELPFGRGKPLGRDAQGALDALIGGWQLGGLFRWTSGFPFNIANGYTWATNWQLGGNAVLLGAPPTTETTKGPNGPNAFADPRAAFEAFRYARPGESGMRNVLRGDGFFNIDMGLSKRWKMPYAESHSVQFRWEVFNITNSVRFDVQSHLSELDAVSEFGNYTGLLSNPRVMQFALRYEF
jgi:hypothetical protein